MKLSKFFLPILKEDPKEAEIVSHRLMLRAGMIKQQASGIYYWLPLGKKVLDKISNIVREEQELVGFNEILMPTIQPAQLWEESGRYQDYGQEMLKFLDRHNREMLYGPTNEEAVTDLFRSYVRSYKELPVYLYQIQWKFRDEVRPRFGVMRGREFLMKDSYSFDLSKEAAEATYKRMFVAYLRSFFRMGLRAIPMRADTGPIGGNLSHEFLILANTGESEVFCDAKYLQQVPPMDSIDYSNQENINSIVSSWTNSYAATEEMHDEKEWANLNETAQRRARGIEVGHIFYFGTKYSEPMRALLMGPDGKEFSAYMGSYGIGISRLVAAAVEASHDESGIIWPKNIAPFDAAIINMCISDSRCNSLSDKLYIELSNMGLDCIVDDKDDRPGVKFARMDLIGIPYQFIIGTKNAAQNIIEVKNRSTGERHNLSISECLNFCREVYKRDL